MFDHLRVATRALIRARWSTILQLVTIAIGVGGLSAVFAVVGAVVLRPLPFDAPQELITIDVTSSRGFRISTSIPNYRDWRDRNRTIATYGGVASWSFRLMTGGETRCSMAARSTETCSASFACGRRSAGRSCRMRRNRARPPLAM